MTAKEAIERLDDMQSQIIHGKRVFGDIADVIRDLVNRDGSQCGYILMLQKELEACRKALLPVTNNPQEDAFYEKAEASVSELNK